MNWVTGICIFGNSACVSWVVSWLELGFWEIQLAFLMLLTAIRFWEIQLAFLGELVDWN